MPGANCSLSSSSQAKDVLPHTLTNMKIFKADSAGAPRAASGSRSTCLALLVALAVLAGCGKQEQKPAASAAGTAPARGQAPGRGGEPPTVLRAALITQEWSDEIASVGTTSANESITLSAKVTETVAKINFSDGDTVRSGDVLVELTGRAEVAALKEAQASFVEADRQYNRLSNVAMKGTVTQSQVDSQAALRDAAQARREAIRARLSDRVIVAPFSGLTGFRMVSPGALVSPGTAITTLDDIDTLKVDFSVPESLLATINMGDTVVAKSTAFPDREFVGKVISMDSRVDPASRAVKVRAQIDNVDHPLRPGMLLSVKLLTQPRQVLAIDEIAVMQLAGDAFVYRADAEGKIQRVIVEIGARKSGMVEIRSGLNPDDQVVGEGTVKVQPGQVVRFVDPATATPVPTQPG